MHYYYYYSRLTARKTWVSWYQKGKTSLDLNEAKNDVVLECSGISWTICKQSTPRSRQITTPVPHHSVVTGRNTEIQIALLLHCLPVKTSTSYFMNNAVNNQVI